jgi:D-arginine dehydrogenase
MNFPMVERADVVIIGGGIAGISLAGRLAPHRDVVVIEMENHLGTHATGRSAAVYIEAYGSQAIRRLSTQSRAFFEAPPVGFSAVPLVHPRGSLVFSGSDDRDRLREEYALAERITTVQWLDQDALLSCCPVLRPEAAAAGFIEPGARDIDTDALLQGFARMARQCGARILTGVPVSEIRHAGDWLVIAGEWEVRADVLVNAAGAWAEEVAHRAGLPGCGLQPMRRTATTLPLPPDLARATADLPVATAVDESFYFKPEAGDMLVSLSEETPLQPCDAYPEDLDIATALERFHEATTVPRARPKASWAGLRTFAADRNPVIGYESTAPGFFWCAGQGGYGLQTAPALSALAASLLLQESLDSAGAALARALSPERFGTVNLLGDRCSAL